MRHVIRATSRTAQTACKIFGVPPAPITKDSPERSVGKTCDLAFGYQGGLKRGGNSSRRNSPTTEVEHSNRVACRASRDRQVLARHRSCRCACGARARPDRPLRPHRPEMHRRVPAAEAAFRPQDLLSAAADHRRQTRQAPCRVRRQRRREVRRLPLRPGRLWRPWTENIVSGIARDLLAEAMLRIEAAGYPIVLHVHDEIVCEVPIGFGSTEEFTRLMTRKPAWAPELPIAASAWTGSRYCK